MKINQNKVNAIVDTEFGKHRKISDWVRKQAGEFPGGTKHSIDRRTKTGKEIINKRIAYNTKSAELSKGPAKSLRRYVAKKMKSKTEEGANLRGKANWLAHQTAKEQSRNYRGE